MHNEVAPSRTSARPQYLRRFSNPSTPSPRDACRNLRRLARRPPSLRREYGAWSSRSPAPGSSRGGEMRNMRCIRHSGRTRTSTVPGTASSPSASASAWCVCLPLAVFVPSAGAGLRVPRVKVAAAELGGVGAVPGWFAKTFGASGRAGRTFRAPRQREGLRAGVAAPVCLHTSPRGNFRTYTRSKTRASRFRAVGMRPRKMSVDLGLEYTSLWVGTHIRLCRFQPRIRAETSPQVVQDPGAKTRT